MMNDAVVQDGDNNLLDIEKWKSKASKSISQHSKLFNRVRKNVYFSISVKQDHTETKINGI
jgi:adenine deaminase